MQALSCIYAGLSVALSSWEKFSFVVFVQLLIQLFRPDIVDVDNRAVPVATEDYLSSYDFIIVGAGSAGAVVANRLSENSNWTCLLLEAGGEPPVLTDVPFLAPVFQKTDIDWQFKTEPMTTACLAMDNQQCNWARGKVLGGSSVLNYNMFVRGNKKDYNHWEELGNDGWSYEDVLPYFKKMENMSISRHANSSYHGTEGYLSIEEPRTRSSLADAYMDSLAELGIPEVDYNGETQSGASYLQNTLKDGLRCSTEKAYIRTASHRENLHVSTYSMVEKVVVDEDTKTATGVVFSRNGQVYTINANKEVILSAGAVKSPHLLLLSGIGPKEQLEKFGINVTCDLPGVGMNLQDHVAIGGLTYMIDTENSTDTTSSNSTDSTSSGLTTVEAVAEFMENYSGSLYGFTGGDSHYFMPTNTTNDTEDYPDVQMIMVAGGDNMAGPIFERILSLKPSFCNRMWKDIEGASSYMIVPMLQRPKSRGSIELRSTDPYEAPVINANFLVEKEDVDALVAASKMTYTISQTATMQKYNARPSPNMTPGCGKFNASSYEFFECHMRHYTFNVHHTSGTCKMGPATDSMAVVDSHLRVHGINGLRVIDASVMPLVTSGNINAPVIMIGEKGSDHIKADHATDDTTSE